MTETLPKLEPGKALYVQIAEAIADYIQAGDLPKGHRLPSQSELMARYNVSQATVRQALLNLSNRGLVRAEQGRGVFVDEPRITSAIGDLGVLTKAHGDQANIAYEMVSTDLLFPPERVADLLEIQVETQIARVRRILRADLRLIGLETSNIPLDVMQIIGRTDLETRDLRAAVSDHPDFRITKSQIKLAAGFITDFDADALGVSNDTIILQREETQIAENNRPVLMQRTILLAAQIEMVTEVAR